ncbi:MAG: aspartate/glutamate racemase family protein [Anaerolineae bacterium]|nr:aspartate/glutamate racemase family protein [Anaerolineae bacterium]MCA9886923.1 aspartate/glutamate racemase family protein [Anaerolineae bacterium]MCA9893045.1 aspartate/glutamate racemase family protein [Anaerolineae bacterium]
MKTIGLIGGLSWESSVEYYRIINESVKDKLGGLHSAQCLLFSFDFAEIETLQMAGDWEKATYRMIHAARQLERGGADGLIICSNTMHLMAEDVQNAVDIPLIHIADATAEAIKAKGIHRIALLGTRFTMEQDFYKGRLQEDHQLEVLIPDAEDRAIVHRIIYEELVLGIIKEESRQAYQQVIEKLVKQGAQGVILGCTEIGLLIKPEHSPVPTFDTTELHAIAAVDWALES